MNKSIKFRARKKRVWEIICYDNRANPLLEKHVYSGNQFFSVLETIHGTGNEEVNKYVCIGTSRSSLWLFYHYKLKIMVEKFQMFWQYLEGGFFNIFISFYFIYFHCVRIYAFGITVIAITNTYYGIEDGVQNKQVALSLLLLCVVSSLIKRQRKRERNKQTNPVFLSPLSATDMASSSFLVNYYPTL